MLHGAHNILGNRKPRLNLRNSPEFDIHTNSLSSSVSRWAQAKYSGIQTILSDGRCTEDTFSKPTPTSGLPVQTQRQDITFTVAGPL